MNIAIYTRKSVYTDNSESINAQYNMCEEYCKNNFKNYTILKYADEGFTGANTKRPEFNKMMESIENNLLDMVVCYRIDRISRSVLDFSKFFNLLEEKNIKFVSVTEKIDTTTPSGRAMMYMSSVFGQMERESIAERIKDTMLDMAKKGYWCGGHPPVGYRTVPVVVNGKVHKTLEIDPDTIGYYNTIIETLVNNNKSLTATATILRKKGMRTPNNKIISAMTLNRIISNPIYAQADEKTYEYFKKLGCKIICSKEKFDGTKGLLRYGRKEGGDTRKSLLADKDEWIISVGLHKHIIDSQTFISLQERIKNNKMNKVRKNEIGILHRIITCKCGYKMRATRSFRTLKNGEKRTYDLYICTRRDLFGKTECDMDSVHIEDLDSKVIDMLKNIALDRKLIENYQEKPAQIIENKNIKKQIAQIEKQINNLTNVIALNQDFNATKHLMQRLEELDLNLNELKQEQILQEKALIKNKKLEKTNEEKHKEICELVDNLENIDYKTLNDALRKLIKECRFDGSTLHIKI